MEKSSTDIYRDKLMEFGALMFALYTGNILHDEQIDMIMNASDS